MSNGLIRPVPSRTAAGSSLCRSLRVRSARATVSKRSSQTRTAKCTLLCRLSRGTYVNVVYPIMLDTAGRSRTLPNTYCLFPNSKTPYFKFLSQSPLSFPCNSHDTCTKLETQVNIRHTLQQLTDPKQQKTHLGEPFIESRRIVCWLTVSISTQPRL